MDIESRCKQYLNTGVRWTISAQEFLAAYAGGRRVFCGADLRDADLRGADLRDANLSDADLRDADLRGADLYRADFRDADLYRADLRGADLRAANLYAAYLSDANLRDADLRDAYLSDANLRDADLRGADLRGAYLGSVDLGSAKSLINTRGIYVAYAPRLSSRGDYLYGGINSEYRLVLYAGCFEGDADDLRAAVKEQHGDNEHARRYEAAIAFIEACYQVDAGDGVWEQMRAANAESETQPS